MSTKKQKREKLQKAREETAKREFKCTTTQTLIGIFALALMFFAWGSHLLPVTDPVESNYALTAKEMVLSGNWLSPQIYGHFGLINLPWCTGSCPSHTAFSALPILPHVSLPPSAGLQRSHFLSGISAGLRKIT